MKSVSVSIFFVALIINGVASSEKGRIRLKENSANKHLTKRTSDEIAFSLLLLKILLENQIKTEDSTKLKSQLKEETDLNLKKENVKSFSDTGKKRNPATDFCSEINVMKNTSLTEILDTLTNDLNTRDEPFNKELLQKNYESLKECFSMEARKSKLWGPLWHCLNRLLLFFVFN